MADLLPVLQVPKGSVTPYVLTVGDPDRAAAIGERLEGGHLAGRFREYHTWQGAWQGLELTVTSHGVGGAGAAVAFEELILGGARAIIRLGTCGSFLPEIRSGDLLVATGAVREDGVSAQLLPLSYPAICDRTVVEALVDAADAHPDVRHATGVMMTKAAFYPGALPDDRATWAQAHLVGVEMELATLLIVAALRGVRAGGAFNVDGNVSEGDVEDPGIYDPHRDVVREGTRRMVQVGLDAIVRLAAKDRERQGQEG
jgi:uridine phosphorylase